MRILLLRHGQDDGNRRGGWSDMGLTEEGNAQAGAAAHVLKQASTMDIRYILSSDLPRAMETAQYLSSELGLPIHEDSRLREMNNGELAGMLNCEASRKYPGLFFNTLDMDQSYPGGESPRDFYSRIVEWFGDISKHPPISSGDLLVVTHGGVINILCHLMEGKPWSNKQPPFPAAACSIHVLNMETRTLEARNVVLWRK